MLEERTFVVTTETGRLDKVLRSFMPDYSRTMIQELIKENYVHVNKETAKSNYTVQVDDQIVVSIPKPVDSEAMPQDLDIDLDRKSVV